MRALFVCPMSIAENKIFGFEKHSREARQSHPFWLRRCLVAQPPTRLCSLFTGELVRTHYYDHDGFCVVRYSPIRIYIGGPFGRVLVVGSHRIKYIRSRRHTGQRRRRWRFPFSFFTRARCILFSVFTIVMLSRESFQFQLIAQQKCVSVRAPRLFAIIALTAPLPPPCPLSTHDLCMCE